MNGPIGAPHSLSLEHFSYQTHRQSDYRIDLSEAASQCSNATFACQPTPVNFHRFEIGIVLPKSHRIMVHHTPCEANDGFQIGRTEMPTNLIQPRFDATNG